MTTISAYLRAECPDHTEPVSFHAPGCDSWDSRVAVDSALARRSQAPKETLYPIPSEEEHAHA